METPEEIQCPSCNEVVRFGANFCQYCGSDLRKVGDEGSNERSDSNRIDDPSAYAISRTDDPGLLNVTWPREKSHTNNYTDESERSAEKEEAPESMARKGGQVSPVVWLAVVAASLLFVAIIRYWSTPSSPESPAPSTASAETWGVSRERQTYSLGFTPDEFRRAWNTKAKEIGLRGVTISRIDVEGGAYENIVSFKFDDETLGTAMAATVNELDQKLKSINILSQPNDLLRATNTLSCWTLLIGVTNPNLSSKQIGNVLKQLGVVEQGADYSKLQGEATVGNIRYTLVGGAPEFVFLSASYANDSTPTNGGDLELQGREGERATVRSAQPVDPLLFGRLTYGMREEEVNKLGGLYSESFKWGKEELGEGSFWLKRDIELWDEFADIRIRFNTQGRVDGVTILFANCVHWVWGKNKTPYFSSECKATLEKVSRNLASRFGRPSVTKDPEGQIGGKFVHNVWLSPDSKIDLAVIDSGAPFAVLVFEPRSK